MAEIRDDVAVAPETPKVVIYYSTSWGSLISLRWNLGDKQFYFQHSDDENEPVDFKVIGEDNPYVVVPQMINILDKWIDNNEVPNELA